MDTSALSSPLVAMPDDIHGWLWRSVGSIIVAGQIAVTTEVYEEMTHLKGIIGNIITSNAQAMKVEIGKDDWNWRDYIEHMKRMKDSYRGFISEYNGKGKAATICLVDMSIVAAAKALGLPVVSMETSAIQTVGTVSKNRRRIPDICKAESVPHLTFSEFLRLEGIRS